MLNNRSLFVLSSIFAATVSYANTSNHLFFQERDFDIQAHAGGGGLYQNNSLTAFKNALEMGVTTLELDTQVTADGHVVVNHDRNLSRCFDTAPLTANDSMYPYTDHYIHELTLAQLKTLDCGSFDWGSSKPDQIRVPGEPMPTLIEIFDLVKSYGADDVLLNVETKVEAGAPEQTAPQDIFVRTVLQVIEDEGMENQVTIQSFDWGALMLARQINPNLPIIALTNGQSFLQVGQDGASPWLGGIDIDDYNGDFVAAVASFGADAISPVHGDPQNGSVEDDNYVAFTTKEMVDSAHANGMKVIPWTIDDPATMNYLIDMGVDGIITDRPDRLRRIMEERGITLPKSYEQNMTVTGLWFEEQKAGTGFNIIEAEAGLAGYYYGYDEDGNTLWLSGGGSNPEAIVLNKAYQIDMYAPKLGNGGHLYMSSPLEDNGIELWGTLEITFTSCTSASATLKGLSLDPVSFNLTRLAQVSNFTCKD